MTEHDQPTAPRPLPSGGPDSPATPPPPDPTGPPPAGEASREELEGRFRTLARPRRRGSRRRLQSEEASRPRFSAKQRLLLLDTWLRSKLPAGDFGALVGISAQTLYQWKRKFLQDGPAGLSDQPRRRLGVRLTDEVKRAILLLKQAHPEWGQDRISAVLARTEAYGVSAATVGRFLEESGYRTEAVPTRPHPDKVRRFERAKPNQLWQTDLFTFVLKRENRRVHLVAFLDDHSRFLVAFGLHASASGALVREVFEAGIVNFGPPEEVLTDNGTQYHTWRGKSGFRKFCERRGIRQIVARPRHPQTLGKIERFWGTLWRELLQGAIFRGLEDARRRIGHFVDHYNFQRPHQGIGNLVPADRYFEAAQEVKETLRARVAAKALELAQHGEPRKPFYLTGRVGGASLSLHAEGDRVVMTREGSDREEVDLSAPGRREESPSVPARDRSAPAPEEAPPFANQPSAAATPSAPPEIPPLARDTAPADPPQLAADSRPLPPGRSPLDGRLEHLAAGLEAEAAPAEEEESRPEPPEATAKEGSR